MKVSRGANLVGMLVFPLDACPYSLLSKKKKKIKIDNHDLFDLL